MERAHDRDRYLHGRTDQPRRGDTELGRVDPQPLPDDELSEFCQALGGASPSRRTGGPLVGLSAASDLMSGTYYSRDHNDVPGLVPFLHERVGLIHLIESV